MYFGAKLLLLSIIETTVNINAGGTQTTEMTVPSWTARSTWGESVGMNLCTTLFVLPLGQRSFPLTHQYVGYRQEQSRGINLCSLIPVLTMFGGLGQPLTPPIFVNPPKYKLSPSLLIHTEQNRVNLVDTMFGAAGTPLRGNTDPNPVPFRPSVTLLSHLECLKLNLIGKDTFFASAGVVPIHDWPNPKSHNYSIELRTFLHNLVLELIGLDQMFDVPGQPLGQEDWQIPQIRVWPYEARGMLIYEPPLVIAIIPPALVTVKTAIINEIDFGPVSIARFIELLRNQ